MFYKLFDLNKLKNISQNMLQKMISKNQPFYPKPTKLTFNNKKINHKKFNKSKFH